LGWSSLVLGALTNMANYQTSKERNTLTLEKSKVAQEKASVAPGIDMKELAGALRQIVQQELATAIPERMGAIRTARGDDRGAGREVARQPVIARDRDGNAITRRRDSLSDQYAVPDQLMDRDWDLQWVRASTYGSPDTGHMAKMMENGWRPIPSDRDGWKGRYMPDDHKGPIEIDGLRLMERPMTLTQEAKAEEKQKHREAQKIQRDQFGLALPEGFSDSAPFAREHTGVRRGTFEAVPGNLAPKYEIAMDADD
jgi:hypothetical protein